MSLANRTRLQVESLDDRLTPSAYTDTFYAYAQPTDPSTGAIYAPPSPASAAYTGGLNAVYTGGLYAEGGAAPAASSSQPTTGTTTPVSTDSATSAAPSQPTSGSLLGLGWAG
jgi:hypothetical protein